MVVLSILFSILVTSLRANELSEGAQAACRCARKFDVCGKTCHVISEFYEKDEDCREGTVKGLCGGEIAMDKTYTEICGTQCPDEDVKAACRCAKKFDVCGETCPAVSNFYDKDDDCKVAVEKGLCGGKLPFDQTYAEICGVDVCPAMDPSVKAACQCAAKFDVCSEDCAAIIPFYNEDESCKTATDEGICGGKFPLDKSYTEICGDLCPKSDKCAKFSSKQCRKNKPTCKYNKAEKKCVEVGDVTVDKCAEADSKKSCKKVHPGCKWFKRKNKCLVRTQN